MTDPKAYRPMSAAEFRDACRAVFGSGYGWQSRVAEALGTDRSTITRWLSGNVPVNGPARAALRTWMRAGYDPQDRG